MHFDRMRGIRYIVSPTIRRPRERLGVMQRVRSTPPFSMPEFLAEFWLIAKPNGSTGASGLRNRPRRKRTALLPFSISEIRLSVSFLSDCNQWDTSVRFGRIVRA